MAKLPRCMAARFGTGMNPDAFSISYFATRSAHDGQYGFVHLVLSGHERASAILKIFQCLFGKGNHLFRRGRDLCRRLALRGRLSWAARTLST